MYVHVAVQQKARARAPTLTDKAKTDHKSPEDSLPDSAKDTSHIWPPSQSGGQSGPKPKGTRQKPVLASIRTSTSSGKSFTKSVIYLALPAFLSIVHEQRMRSAERGLFIWNTDHVPSVEEATKSKTQSP